MSFSSNEPLDPENYRSECRIPYSSCFPDFSSPDKRPKTTEIPPRPEDRQLICMVQESCQSKDATPFPQRYGNTGLKRTLEGERQLRILSTISQPSPSHSSSSCWAMQSLSKNTVTGDRKSTERIRCQKKSTKGKTE